MVEADVDVAAVELEHVDAPVGEGGGVRLDEAEGARVAAAREGAVVPVEAQAQSPRVHLNEPNPRFRPLLSCFFLPSGPLPPSQPPERVRPNGASQRGYEAYSGLSALTKLAREGMPLGNRRRSATRRPVLPSRAFSDQQSSMLMLL